MEKIPAIESLRELLERQLARIEATEAGVRDGSDPRELHRFRVAGRRSRALIRASRQLAGGQLARLDGELRWLGGLSGPVRDLDVLIAHLEEVVERLDPDRAGGEAILSGLRQERDWAREALLEALDDDRFQTLLSVFRQSLASLEAVDHDVGLKQIARREFKRLRAAYEDLGPEPADDELHAVRIKAKRLRYAAELAELAEGGTLGEVIEAATELQDLIGTHQDAVVAERRVRALATRESLLAAGRIVEHERSRRAEARRLLPQVWERAEGAANRAF